MHLVALSLIAAISAVPKAPDMTQNYRPSIAQILRNQIIIAEVGSQASNTKSEEDALDVSTSTSIDNQILAGD